MSSVSPCKRLRWLPEENTSSAHSSDYPACFGKRFGFDSASQKSCERSEPQRSREAPLTKPDLVFTVVRGPQPACVRVAALLIFHKPALPSPLAAWAEAAHQSALLTLHTGFGLTSSGHQTAGSPPTSHRVQLGEIYSRQKCRRKICADLATHPGLDIVTRNEEQQRPIIASVGEHNEAGRVPNSILHRTNPEHCTQPAADARPRPTPLSSTLRRRDVK